MQTTSSRRRKSERKITRMVVVVVAVFILCWLPFYLLNIVNLLMVLPGDFRGLYVFVVVLSYANSCANPILYGFLSDNFKRGFRKALCGSSRRVNNDRTGTKVQRPTEEWGGIVLQVQRSKGVVNVEKTDCGGKDEEEGLSGVEGDMQLREMCKTRENENHSGAAEGSRTQAVLGGKPEQEPSAHSLNYDPDSAPAASSTGGTIRSRKSQPDELEDKHSVLDISRL